MSDNPSSDPPPPSGTNTPGWNDPPKVQYNPLAASNCIGRPKLNLNKRVAFPLQGSSTSSATIAKPTAIVQPSMLTSPQSLPPSSAPPVHQPVAVVHPYFNAPPPMSRLPQMPAAAAQQEQEELLPNDAQQVSSDIFNERVPLIQESTHIRRDEIERRIALIDQLWQSGNLTQAVQTKIYHIARAIAENNLNEAMETYTLLVVNHSLECSTWAVALRHIVLTLQTQTNTILRADSSSNSITDQDSNNPTPSLPVNCVFVPAMPRSVVVFPTDADGEVIALDGLSASSFSSATVQHI